MIIGFVIIAGMMFAVSGDFILADGGLYMTIVDKKKCAKHLKC